MPSYVPKEARQHAAHWHASCWQRFDAFQLAKNAAALYSAMAPKAGEQFELAMLWWISNCL